MISGLMAAVGATVTEASEGQQIMGLFTIPIWLPYIFIDAVHPKPKQPAGDCNELLPTHRSDDDRHCALVSPPSQPGR